MHPAQAISGTSSNSLAGRTILLGVCGSIAAVETVKLARELIRHGAEVIAVMTGAAQQIVTADALHYATGVRPIVALSGDVEHVRLCGEQHEADLLLIAPATANTIAKVALGIDDSPVTTCAATAIGSGMPVLIAPAMHAPMERHPRIQEHLQALRTLGVGLIEPTHGEGIAKLASIETIVAHVQRTLGDRTLFGRSVLVISGPTAQPVDDMRLLTNRSTGATGRALAAEAWLRGARVQLWCGSRHVPLPDHLQSDVQRFGTIDELLALVEAMPRVDVVLMPAAVADYSPTPVRGKIPSGSATLALTLRRTPKVIDRIRKAHRGVLVGFKATSGAKEAGLRTAAGTLAERARLDLVVANDLGEVDDDHHRVLLLDDEGSLEVHGSKAAVASAILSRVCVHLARAKGRRRAPPAPRRRR